MVTGELTTAGTPADYYAANHILALISIDTLVLDEEDQTSAFWMSGSAPAFSRDPFGDIRTNVSGVAFLNSNTIHAASSDLVNSIQLGRSTSQTSFALWDPDGNMLFEFSGSTSLTPIPEPSAFLYLGLIAAGVVGVATVKSRCSSHKKSAPIDHS